MLLRFRKCYFPNCTYTKEDLQSIGAVSVFINNKKYLEIEGDANFGEFGSSISVGHPYGDGSSFLAVSSPGKGIDYFKKPNILALRVLPYF